MDQLALIGAIANDRDKALKAVSGELDASSTAFHQDRACPHIYISQELTDELVYTMLLANHDLAEPYVASKLRQFQQSQYKTLYDKLNIPVDVRVPLLHHEQPLTCSPTELCLSIRSG